MQGRGAALPPIGVALDGDLAHRLDGLLAIALFNGLFARGESRLIALSLSRPSLRGAQLVEVVSAFYTPRPREGVGMVGMPEGPMTAMSDPPAAAILDREGPEGPLYEVRVKSLIDTADNAVLIRNMLLAQHDGNAAIVLAGPATGLVRLMKLYGARPQIEAKVARLVLAVGAFGADAAPDPAVAADVAAARTLLEEWPTPIVAVGREVGEAVAYPAASFERDFAWAPAHPLVDAYRAAGEPGRDVPATTLAAVLHAVHPGAGHFDLSPPGEIAVAANGRTTFTAGGGGRHRHLIVNPARRDEVVRLWTELVAAPPAPRGRRGGPPTAANQPPQPPVPPTRPPAAAP